MLESETKIKTNERINLISKKLKFVLRPRLKRKNINEKIMTIVPKEKNVAISITFRLKQN